MSIIEEDPLFPLQLAMATRLEADEVLQELGVRVFDFVNADYYPRIVIGEDRGQPDDNDCTTVTWVNSTVRVYTNEAGREFTKKIAGRIRFLLTLKSGFKVDGFDMAVGHCDRVRIEAHEDDHIYQGIVEFEYRFTPLSA